MKIQYLLIILFINLLACSPDQDPRMKRMLSEGMKARKIKRVKDSDLLNFANFKGKEVIDKLNDKLIPNLNPQQPFSCKINDYLPDTLRFKYLTQYRLVCNNQDCSYPKETEIWQAYIYNSQKGIENIDNIQKIDNEVLLYNSPITVNGKLIAMWSLILDKKALIKDI